MLSVQIPDSTQIVLIHTVASIAVLIHRYPWACGVGPHIFTKNESESESAVSRGRDGKSAGRYKT